MQKNNLKNIVVLKNLPSNIIDEAIVILKSNKNAKKLQLADKNAINTLEEHEFKDDYVIKEAENVIANFISKIEKPKETKKINTNIESKYKNIKIYSIIVSVILFMCLINSLV